MSSHQQSRVAFAYCKGAWKASCAGAHDAWKASCAGAKALVASPVPDEQIMDGIKRVGAQHREQYKAHMALLKQRMKENGGEEHMGNQILNDLKFFWMSIIWP